MPVRREDKTLSFCYFGSRCRKSFLDRGQVGRRLIHAGVVSNLEPIVGLMLAKVLKAEMIVKLSYFLIVSLNELVLPFLLEEFAFIGLFLEAYFFKINLFGRR